MRSVFAAAAAVAACALALASTAVAAPALEGPTIPDLVNKNCPLGTTVASVAYGIANAADYGALGNVWAFDGSTRDGGAAFTRQLVIIRVNSGVYCAATRDSGYFTTVTGLSPGGTGLVRGGRTGTFVGGYRTTLFTGVFEPKKPTLGPLGTYDYDCDALGQCPGYVDWRTWYFPAGVAGYGVTPFGIARWTFSYSSAGQWWWNSYTGNSSDITG
jgi:hypothetical protein